MIATRSSRFDRLRWLVVELLKGLAIVGSLACVAGVSLYVLAHVCRFAISNDTATPVTVSFDVPRDGSFKPVTVVLEPGQSETFTHYNRAKGESHYRVSVSRVGEGPLRANCGYIDVGTGNEALRVGEREGQLRIHCNQ